MTERTFRGDLVAVRERLARREPFALARFGDSETDVVRCDGSDGRERLTDGQFEFFPRRPGDMALREELRRSLVYRHPSYYVGLSCPHCYGDEQFDWMRNASGQDDEQLTWATLFYYSNYDYFGTEVVPLFARYEVWLVGNRNVSLDRLPFRVARYFPIGFDAWRTERPLIDELIAAIRRDAVTGRLFLLCGGLFACILAHRLHEAEPRNTYLDVGSALDPWFFEGEKGKTRRYLIYPETRERECTWGREAAVAGHTSI